MLHPGEAGPPPREGDRVAVYCARHTWATGFRAGDVERTVAVSVGPEYGTVDADQVREAARKVSWPLTL